MDKIKLRNLIANAEVEDSDNLAIVIATYYDDHPRCPDERDDTETGWKPWVMEQTDKLLDAAVANILEANSRVEGSEPQCVKPASQAIPSSPSSPFLLSLILPLMATATILAIAGLGAAAGSALSSTPSAPKPPEPPPPPPPVTQQNIAGRGVATQQRKKAAARGLNFQDTILGGAYNNRPTTLGTG